MVARAFTVFMVLLPAATGLTGCLARQGAIAFNSDTAQHYQTVATRMEFADVATVTDPCTLAPPLVITAGGEPQYWDLTLEECVHLALENSRVLRDLGGTLLRSPEAALTVYNPAIEETHPRFGVDAALSEFDAIFSAQALGGKNDRPLNVKEGPNTPDEYVQDTALVEGAIAKRAVTGSMFSLRHTIAYDANSTPSNKFPSIWNTFLEGEVRQPLLQGAGVEYNRIAGSARTAFGGVNGLPGLTNGVLIARVNTDISLTDFEIGVRDLVSNVENAYWDLYYAYRDLDAKIAGRNAALESWRRIQALYIAGRKGGEAEREAGAREQYLRFEEEVKNALAGRPIEGTQTDNGSKGGTFRATGGVHISERRLRLLLGLPITDGRLIRPAEEPPLAKVVFDWGQVTGEALIRRTELRRQKWYVKRRELELTAARNFLLPQLDAVGLYRWRGLGNMLISDIAGPPNRFDDAYDNLFNGYYQEWQLGMEFTMPFGFRRGHVAVRNAQLQLARERAILREQEREVMLGLSNAIAEVERAWSVVQTNYNRRLAAGAQLAAAQAAFDADKADLDLVLESQRRKSDADTRYFGALTEYALAIKNVHFEKGSLLEYSEVFLAEGPWPLQAYDDADMRRFRDRPIPPLNYVFKKGAVIDTLPPGRPISEPVAVPEMIPLPPPDEPASHRPVVLGAEQIPAPAPVPVKTALPAGD
jgi:outer membrane protein TolC